MTQWRWRKFQKDGIELAKDIVAGYHPDLEIIVGDITCGYGKSSLPPILIHHLKPTGIKYVVWIAPRRTLLGQAEDAFLKKDMRRALGHNLAIRQSTNDYDPAGLNDGPINRQGEERAGYVTTYSAIAADKNAKSNLDWCKKYRKRYLLVLDEAQQVYEGCGIETYIKEMHLYAGLTLVMSGTFQRGDGKRVSLAEYNPMGNGRWQLRTRNEAHYHYISGSRLEALKDHALIESEVEFMDAQGRFRLKGEEIDFESLRTVEKENLRRAIDTALKTEHAKTMMDFGTDHWRAHRKVVDRSKALYIAPDIPRAKEYVEYLKSRHGLGSSEIEYAVSDKDGDDSPEALKTLERFKDESRNGLKALVAVGMVYMGFDVPPLDHLINLSKPRTSGWQGQALARPARFDTNKDAKPYDQQKAYIWTPDDSLMHAIVDEILADQAAIARDQEEGTGGGGGTPEFSQPISSISTTSNVQELSHGETLDQQKTSIVKGAQDDIIQAGGSPIPKLAMWEVVQKIQNGGYGNGSANRTAEAPTIRASASEKLDQQEVETLVKTYVNSKIAYDPKNPTAWRNLKRQIDTELNKFVNKQNRDQWGESDYKRVIERLHGYYLAGMKWEVEI